MNEVAVYSSNVVKLTTEIKVIQDNVCQGMIEIGKRLIEIKKELCHGQWLPYLENELGYSNQTGNRLMKVATEFGDLNSSISRNIQSSKVIELLSLPLDYRENFTNNNPKVEDITVKQLREEIKKYKEENGLLTEKQLKALEEKREAEQDKQRLQAELQREKSKPANVEEYDDKIKHLEDTISVLNEREEINETLISNCKKEVEEYKQFKNRLLNMQSVSGGDYDEVVVLKQIDDLYVNIDGLIRNELSPVKYNGCIRFINNSQYINDSFNALIDTVQEWCDDMRNELNNNNNIITVEVK